MPLIMRRPPLELRGGNGRFPVASLMRFQRSIDHGQQGDWEMSLRSALQQIADDLVGLDRALQFHVAKHGRR